MRFIVPFIALTSHYNKKLRLFYLVEVVLLLEPHSHFFEVFSVCENNTLSVSNFIQKHFHTFGLFTRSIKMVNEKHKLQEDRD